jgi:hypothetical protein
LLTNLPTAILLPIKSLLFYLFLSNLSGCSSMANPVIYHSSFDFSQVQKYSFYQRDSTFFDSQSLAYSQRNRIEIAIEKSLNKQGFVYSDLEVADIIVTYHLVKGRNKDYQEYNKVVLFCSHCLKANTWQQGNKDWAVYPDGLIIDLVDPKKNRSVWRSIYPLKSTQKDNSKTANEKIIEAVNIMLMQYPKK